MHATQRHDPDLVTAHTTAAASSIARWVEQHHGLAVQQCHLIRRGLNDNYALRSVDGSRYVVRLYSIRPRGDFNADFELSLLAHLDAHGVAVAVPVPTAQGRTHVELRFPEGLRAMALFRHAPGAVPDTLEDFEQTGGTLARMHTHPELDRELLNTYRQLVQGLLAELAQAKGGLSRVICHGDTHGFNNHIATNADGAKSAVFFDFDDAGPGFLAYDLCVMPWSYLTCKSLKEPDELLLERWAHYLQGYRSAGGEVTPADMAALPLFVQLRHLWNMGEALGRLHHWGTSPMPVDWLRKQVDVFAAWKALDLQTP